MHSLHMQRSAVEATPGPGTIERQALVLSSILTALAAAGSLDEATEVDSQASGRGRALLM